MEEITVNIGELVMGDSGIMNDTRQAVEFTGELLGEYREYGTDRQGKITDTRGTTQTLYRTADGGLVVHVHDWSHWTGEPDTESLYAATEADLQPNGRFARLGAACGLGRPLTLAEAIGPAGQDTPTPFEEWVQRQPGLADVGMVRIPRADVDNAKEIMERLANVGKAGFLFEVLGNDSEDWDMIESFLTWLLSVAKIENEPMQRLAACLNDLLQSRPDTNED